MIRTLAPAAGRVKVAEGKIAGANDLRRAFGTRWASRVIPATLQMLMRHASIDTTLKYYVALDADDVAGELWSAVGRLCPESVRTARVSEQVPIL